MNGRKSNRLFATNITKFVVSFITYAKILVRLRKSDLKEVMMKYKISIITLALFLAGCSAPPLSPTPTPAPTQTYTPAPTATIPSTATPEATATMTPTATPEISQFKVCNKIENYADCPITVDDLFNGNYLMVSTNTLTAV